MILNLINIGWDIIVKVMNNLWVVSTNNLQQQFYTLEEQIERYSRNLAYWYIQLEMDGKGKYKQLKHIQPKETFIKSQIIRLMNTTKQIFPPDVPTLVHQMAVDIKNSTLNEQMNTHTEFFTPPEIKHLMYKSVACNEIN